VLCLDLQIQGDELCFLARQEIAQKANLAPTAQYGGFFIACFAACYAAIEINRIALGSYKAQRQICVLARQGECAI
jgi:hypothetical protein